MNALKVKLPRVSERQEQTAIVKLLRSLGGQVYVIGTVRPTGDFHGTCQTPGIPDLLCFLPPLQRMHLPRLVFIEVKAAGGRMRPAQQEFREQCRGIVDHLVGNADVVIAWLTAQGYLR